MEGGRLIEVKAYLHHHENDQDVAGADRGEIDNARNDATDKPGTLASDEPPQAHSFTSVKATVLQYIKNYLEHTTVHGFKYVVTAVSPVERIAWMGFVVLAFIAAFMMIGIYAFEAITNPITISLSTIPVSQVPFPAVSVDSGKSWDHMGYPRKALGRTLPDESSEGEYLRPGKMSCSCYSKIPDIRWLMEMIHTKAYDFWVKELRKHTSDIHTVVGSTQLFRELFDNEYRLKIVNSPSPKLYFVDSFFHSLAIMHQNGEGDNVQHFPFIMIDNLTTLLAALHFEQGERVSKQRKLTWHCNKIGRIFRGLRSRK